MRYAAPALVLRLALLAAVFTCAVLVVEYDNTGDFAFCGIASGCTVVRRSVYSKVAGIPLPVLGLCAHAGLLSLALLGRKSIVTTLVAVAATVGGIIALGLIGIQVASIGTVCVWCLAVDLSSLVAAVAAVANWHVSRGPSYHAWLAALQQHRAHAATWAAGSAVIAALPFVWGRYPIVPPPPHAVAALAVPGKVTIVSFTDFQCPYCRKMHLALNELQDDEGGRIAVVLKMAPLAAHPGAMPGALAYVCTPADRREQMAHELYTAPAALLTHDGLIVIAGRLELNAATFARCIDDSASIAAIAEDLALFDSLGGHGLPYTFVGHRVIAGYDHEALRRLSQRVMAGEAPGLPVSWLFATVGLVAVVLIGLTLRIARREAELHSPAGAA